jgi:hypothetical protein
MVAFRYLLLVSIVVALGDGAGCCCDGRRWKRERRFHSQSAQHSPVLDIFFTKVQKREAAHECRSGLGNLADETSLAAPLVPAIRGAR